MKKYDLVAEGGGAKITALAGAIDAIESQGFTPARCAGSSAGAIIASARAVGYGPAELKQLVFDTDFREFLDGNGWGKKLWNLIRHLGVYKGDKFYEYTKELLKAKNVFTFGDLLADNPKERDTYRTRWKLRVFVADLSSRRLVTFPDDAFMYGILPDKLDVALAIRASISMPVVFQPIYLQGKYLVDGGLLSNFPIDVWDSRKPRWPTFGLLLAENESFDIGFMNFFSYTYAIFDTMLKAHDKTKIRPDDYKYRTIKIPVGSIRATDFGLSSLQKDNLYQSGYNSALRFLDKWDWNSYRRWAMNGRRIPND